MFAARRPPLRRLAWLALVAVLALALLPTVSRAAAGGGSGWAEVCSAQGLRVVAQGGEPLPGPQLDHCVLCPLSAQPVLLPPPAAGVAAPQWVRSAHGTSLHAPHARHAWRGLPARGPPARG